MKSFQISEVGLIIKEKVLEPKTVKKSDVSPNQQKKNKLVNASGYFAKVFSLLIIAINSCIFNFG